MKFLNSYFKRISNVKNNDRGILKMKQQTIMIVDDAPDNLLLLEMVLEDEFNVVQATSGKECLDLIEKSVPDILLLDVNMPGMTGYEVCIQLRKNTLTQLLPVIFVSAMINSEEKLAGFEAGGNEYINKPVDEQLLMEKIRFHLEHVQERKNIQQNASEAMNVAMDAMTSSSELGQLIEFVTAAQNAKTLVEMGDMIINVCGSFGLKVSAYLPCAKSEFFGCEQTGIEATILERSLKATEKITNLGIRTIVKSEQISLLVKNMPIEDSNKYGRFKDHLAVLISICDGRILTIKSEVNVDQQRKKTLVNVINHTENKIKELNKKVEEHDQKAKDVMVTMIQKLETTLFSLGLDEDQEERLMQLVYKTSEKLEDGQDATKQLQDDLGGILYGLYEIMEANE